MGEDSLIGPQEDPYASGHLPVSGEYGSHRKTSDDRLTYDVDDRRDLSPLENDLAESQ